MNSNGLMHSFLGERSEAYSQKDTSKWFRFFPVRDIPLRFISLNVIFSAPISRICPILYKHYDGFTIYHIPNFRPLKFFRRVSSDKNFNFRIF